MKQKTRQNYRKRADIAFAKWVRSRGYCESPRDKHKGNLQCAHIIGRRYGAIRTDPDNALCLCAGCHVFYTHRPLEWRQFIDEIDLELWPRLTAIALSEQPPDWKAEAEYWESHG